LRLCRWALAVRERSRIGGSRSIGIWSDSRGLQLSNVIFYTTSFAGPDAAPVIRLGAATIDAMSSKHPM
jgi:hypothetical protein